MTSDSSSSTASIPAEPATAIGDLSYEDARDELVAIVAQIEGGNASLEESMQLWERGEALAAHCQAKLDQAQEQLDRGSPGSSAGDPASSTDADDIADEDDSAANEDDAADD